MGLREETRISRRGICLPGSLICFCCSIAQSCPALCNPWTEAHQASLSYTTSRSLRKLMSIESVMSSNLCCRLLLLPSVFSSIRVFCNELTLGQSIGVSASLSVLPMNNQGWFPLGLTGLISLLSKGPLRVFSSTTVQKHQFFGTQLLWASFNLI